MFLKGLLVFQMEGNACWDISKSQELDFLYAEVETCR